MFRKISTFFSKLNKKEVIVHKGLKLPGFRTNQSLSSNEEYLHSGVEQVDFLKSNGLLINSSKILDFGCGQGRLVNALEYSNTQIASYTGIDTDKKSIDWCRSNLNYNEKYNFIHLPAYNERYNKSVQGLKEIPFGNDSFDLIFLNSVFSHMLPQDIAFYLGEFHRILKRDGFVYLTAFIEQDVPDVEENPDDYLTKSSGALHRVRYEQQYFMQLVEKSNFEVLSFHHQFIKRTSQSVVILKRNR